MINPEQTEGLKSVELLRENKNILLDFDFAGKRGLQLNLVRGESEEQVLERLRKFAADMMNNRGLI